MGTTDGGNFLTDLTNGTLPAFSFVTPDLCNDTHDCPVATGDAWLQSWFAKILASPTYLAGRTVVFLVWDEDDGSASNHVPLIVVSPSTPAGHPVGDVLRPLLAAEDDRAAPRDHDVPRPRRRRRHDEHGLGLQPRLAAAGLSRRRSRVRVRSLPQDLHERPVNQVVTDCKKGRIGKGRSTPMWRVTRCRRGERRRRRLRCRRRAFARSHRWRAT